MPRRLSGKYHSAKSFSTGTQTTFDSEINLLCFAGFLSAVGRKKTH